MQMQGEIEDLRSSPSLKCYSFDSITSKAIRETEDEEDEDFEFKLLQNDDESSLKDIDSQNWTVFPVFNREFEVNNEAGTEIKVIKPKRHERDTLKKLYNDQPEEYSLEDDELERLPSGTFCVWRPSNCEKSSSIGSGISKGWIIRYLLQWSICDDKEPVLLLSTKEKRRSGEGIKIAGKWKGGTAVHERFYVERRAENEVGKKKSYLPYRKDLVGLSFASVNGMARMLPGFDMIKP